MKAQAEQIQDAKRAYILQLSNTRFAVYLDEGEGLNILWPSDSDLGKKSKEMLPDQIYSKHSQYPAFHFRLGGSGYSKTNDIRSTLQRVNPLLRVFCLHGWSPS